MDDMTAALGGAIPQMPDNPLMSMLLQQMAARQEADRTPDQEVEQLKARLQRASRLIGRLRAEAAAANEMASFVARVLGACPRCWGLDRFCRECLGAGTPGSRAPEAAELLDWVGPALQRAGLTAVPSTASDSTQEPDTTQQRPMREGAPHAAA